jgi:hypothetical protein
VPLRATSSSAAETKPSKKDSGDGAPVLAYIIAPIIAAVAGVWLGRIRARRRFRRMKDD